MKSIASLVALLSFATTAVLAQGGGQRCGPGALCPGSAPCCSEYGFCGTGQFCLGGCNPMWSKSLDSCLAAPICKDATYTFKDQSKILSNSTLFSGNASVYDWVVESGSAVSNGDGINLVLTKNNGGTKISLTHYLHYGTVSATMKTSKWAGVVTAFITMSAVKDEIDWEWPGVATTEAQTNYFWMGVVPDFAHTHGTTVKNLTDTFDNYHKYTIDWQKDALTFLIDGKEVRKIERPSTANSDANGRMEYPTTPARIQLSLWPAGIPASGQGTIDWAGGMINWDDPYYVANGQFQASVQSVEVKCADKGTLPPGTQSYVYGPNGTDQIPTILSSNSTGVIGAAGRRADLNSLGGALTWMSLAAVGGFITLAL